ncbi:MAG TPA: ShlB/FhaC/HecB family hemolysin secretion/activation protein [Povalibacter sp.]|nr:ShlB/FhaC/HecB family hemolysin secretion/activation protein [Povalibacter sp.]
MTAQLALSAEQAPQAPAAQEHFDVYEIRVLGNTVLPKADIERAIYPHLGPGKSLDDVEAARTALAESYARAGFGTVLVDIPEQAVDEGIVRLQVTEGRVDRVRISGARYFANGQLRAQIDSVSPGHVPDLKQFQRQLGAAAGQSADRTITPVLRAGRTPGTVDVELKVKDNLPLHGSLEVNDRYTADTTETRVDANLSYNNLFQRFHSLSLQYQTAPENPSETRVIAGTYVIPIEGTRNAFAVYAVDTDSDVATVGTLSVLGKGQIYGARFILGLPSGRSLGHTMAFGADFKDFDENILLVDAPAQQTPISYVNWSATWSGGVHADVSFTNFSLGANFGIRGLANDPDEFAFKRYSGTPNQGDPGYFYLRGNLEHEQPLFAGMRWYVRAATQLTTHALISNEQFSIGGADSVRGYLEAEALGDYGVSGSLELHSASWHPAFLGSDFSIYGLGFADAGIVALVAPLPGQISDTGLYSVGAGMRFIGFGGMQGSLDWAYPLIDSTHIERGDSRIHFQVRYGF